MLSGVLMIVHVQLESFVLLVVPSKEDLVYKLKSPLHDLKQFPRQWYKMVDSLMIAHDFKRCQYN
jgi:hypothetical protein